jgi:hypothetical protein
MYAITPSERYLNLEMCGRTLEMAEICLLVEGGLVETERVDNVVDLDGAILDTFLGLLSRCVGTSVCISILAWSY